MDAEGPLPAPLLGLPQAALTVPDLDRALAFYQGALGLGLLFRSPGMAMLACGEARLLLAVPALDPAGQGAYLYFRVADARAAQAALAARGVPFEGPPHAVGTFAGREVWLATFLDPAGRRHHLLAEVPAAPGPA